MSCFNLGFLESLLIYLVVVIAVVSVIKILIPWLDSFSGFPIIGRILEIVLWAVVAILIIYLVFALISCLLGSGPGLHLPHG